ncbi:MAG: tetratricopeptide repeat protein [Thermoplasmatota archaeon]
MKDAMERLDAIDPSDSMEGTIGLIDEVLKDVEKNPKTKEAEAALGLIGKKEKGTRDYYMRPLDSDDIYNRLVQVHLERGEESAADGYRRCLDLRQARKWTILGDSYALMGINKRAVIFLKRALFFGPSDDLVDEVQKTYEKALKRVEKAEAEIEKTLAKLNDDPDSLKNSVQASSNLLDLDRIDEAKKVIEKARKSSPEDFDVLYRHGLVLFGMDKFKEAKKVFEKSLELNPKSANAKRAFNLSEEMMSNKL